MLTKRKKPFFLFSLLIFAFISFTSCDFNSQVNAFFDAELYFSYLESTNNFTPITGNSPPELKVGRYEQSNALCETTTIFETQTGSAIVQIIINPYDSNNNLEVKFNPLRANPNEDGVTLKMKLTGEGDYFMLKGSEHIKGNDGLNVEVDLMITGRLEVVASQDFLADIKIATFTRSWNSSNPFSKESVGQFFNLIEQKIPYIAL